MFYMLDGIYNVIACFACYVEPDKSSFNNFLMEKELWQHWRHWMIHSPQIPCGDCQVSTSYVQPMKLDATEEWRSEKLSLFCVADKKNDIC